MNTNTTIAIACFFGALTGSLVALQMGRLWFFGAMVGAAVGYITYDFKKVIRVVSMVWRNTVAWQPQPDWELWKERGLSAIGSANMTLSVLTYMILPFFYREGWKVITFRSVRFALVLIFLMSLYGTTFVSRRKDGTIFRLIHSKDTNIFSFSWCILGISFLVAKKIGVFIGTVFRIIHSDLRLLCAADAAIGSAIGYYFGNALAGGIAGAIFGFLNYEIVSVRLLHIRRS